MSRVNPKTTIKHLIDVDLVVNRQIVMQLLHTRLADGYSKPQRKAQSIVLWQAKICRLADRWISRFGLQKRWRLERKVGDHA